MALFLGLLGGAAAVEIHRQITRNFDDERHPRRANPADSTEHIATLKHQRMEMISLIESLKRQESSLSASIAAISEELERSEATSKAESARLNRVCQQLKEQLELAETQHREVCQAYNELEAVLQAERKDHEQLKSLHESVVSENSMLISQFERLKTKYDEETSVLQRQITMLQENVSIVVTEYVYGSKENRGELSIEEVERRLEKIGVELGEGERARLEAGLKMKRGKERAKVVEGLEVRVEKFDLSVMKCANSPTRAARLFFAGERGNGNGNRNGNGNGAEETMAGETIKAVHGKVGRKGTGGRIVVPVTEVGVGGGKVGVRA